MISVSDDGLSPVGGTVLMLVAALSSAAEACLSRAPWEAYHWNRDLIFKCKIFEKSRFGHKDFSRSTLTTNM
jgi:hypothetical protein